VTKIYLIEFSIHTANENLTCIRYTNRTQIQSERRTATIYCQS